MKMPSTLCTYNQNTQFPHATAFETLICAVRATSERERVLRVHPTFSATKENITKKRVAAPPAGITSMTKFKEHNYPGAKKNMNIVGCM
jgi:hypothetical protein